MKKQSGFTLVELVVVIVILGILAATALPRFINVTVQARTASLDGVVGGVASAVALCQAAWMAAGSSGGTCIMVGGSAGVSSVTGIPLSTAGGIDNAVQNLGGFTYAPGPTTGQFNMVPAVPGCHVLYTAATGVASRVAAAGFC